MKKNNHGFTLVELLAVIAILGIVVSITVYVGINAVNKAKEKSYKTTKNNIENIAGTYLKENGDRLFYISKNDGTGIEYQCITIENLIDGGYFKNDVLNSQVSKDDKVKESDYIYIERNSATKSVVKNVYVLNGEDNGVCPSAVKAESDISFLVNPLEWSKTKEITITYKLKNANNINDYGYEYSYSNDKIELISDDGNLKKVKVLDNGTLTGIIKYLGEESYSKDLKIDKIDNIGPVISLGDNKSGYVREKAEINLKVSDFGIGVDNNSFTKDDVIVKVEDKEISQDNLTLTVDNNGSVKLVVNNKVLDGNVNVQIKAGGVLDKLGNSNDIVALDTGIIFDNTAPTCSLSVSGTTITATFEDNTGGSGINGEATKKATVSDAKNYTFTAYDYAGNSKTCIIEVIDIKSTTETIGCIDGSCQVCTTRTTCGGEYCKAIDGKIYYQRWLCEKNGGTWTRDCKKSTSCSLKSKPCESGYKYNSSKGNCQRTVKYCPDKYTQIDDSYCYMKTE